MSVPDHYYVGAQILPWLRKISRFMSISNHRYMGGQTTTFQGLSLHDHHYVVVLTILSLTKFLNLLN